MVDREQIKSLLLAYESAGGVSDEAIRDAELRLGVRFPPSYRTFLAEYGNIHGTPFEIAGLSQEIAKDDEPPYWWDVVACNIQLRRVAGELIPKDYVAISDDGGDYKFDLDTNRRDSQGECPVIVLGPGMDGVVVANSFIDFLRRSIERTIDF